MVFMPAVVYLVDVYLFDANSALAANAFVRAIVAAAFPLFATYMYEALGVQVSSVTATSIRLKIILTYHSPVGIQSPWLPLRSPRPLPLLVLQIRQNDPQLE
jgi:hypothetical protein